MEGAAEQFLEMREAEAVQPPSIDRQIWEIAEQVEEGHADALLAYHRLKELAEQVSAAKEVVYLHAIQEAENYGEKAFEHKGLKVERRNGAARWNYKGIPEWDQADKDKKELEKTLKSRYELYKKGELSIDQESGEQLPVPSVTYSKDSIIIKK